MFTDKGLRCAGCIEPVNQNEVRRRRCCGNCGYLLPLETEQLVSGQCYYCDCDYTIDLIGIINNLDKQFIVCDECADRK
jgi:hypothetical protein